MTPRWPRRTFLKGVAAAGAAGLVVACGGDGGGRPARQSLASSPAPTATARAAGRNLSGTITVSYPDELGKKPPYVQQAAATVRQANPNATITIDLQKTPSGEFYTALLGALAAGEGPDVLHVGGDRIGELADAGYIAPLDEYVKSWPDWQYFPPTVTESVTYQGRVWAIPYGLDTRFLYYRRDIFEQVGLGAGWQPKHVGEVIEAAARVKAQRPDVIPYVLYAGTAGDTGTANHGFLPLLWAYGGELQDKSGAWIGNGPAIRKALAYYARAYLADKVTPPEVYTMQRPWVGMRERFGAGSVALLFEGGWVYGGWLGKDRAGTERNVGYMLHPTERGGPSFTIGGPGTCWFISARSPYKDLAWEFITAFNSRDIAGRLTWEDPHPVARVDAVKVPEYRNDKFLVDATESLRRAHFTPVDADYGKVVSAIQRATVLVASGEASPDDAAVRYAEDLRAALGAARVITLS